MKRVMDMMESTECDDDIRALTREMPEGVLEEVGLAPRSSRRTAQRRSRVDSPTGCLRAFTVHPGWAWAILEGVKTREWRTFLPHPSAGTCAITVSKSYSPSQWRDEAKFVLKDFGVKLIPYEELVAEWCGKVVAVCDYAADEDDWDVDAYGWRLSNVRPLENRIPCKGNLKLWTMDVALSKRVFAEI